MCPPLTMADLVSFSNNELQLGCMASLYLDFHPLGQAGRYARVHMVLLLRPHMWTGPGVEDL